MSIRVSPSARRFGANSRVSMAAMDGRNARSRNITNRRCPSTWNFRRNVYSDSISSRPSPRWTNRYMVWRIRPRDESSNNSGNAANENDRWRRTGGPGPGQHVQRHPLVGAVGRVRPPARHVQRDLPTAVCRPVALEADHAPGPIPGDHQPQPRYLAGQQPIQNHREAAAVLAPIGGLGHRSQVRAQRFVDRRLGHDLCRDPGVVRTVDRLTQIPELSPVHREGLHVQHHVAAECHRPEAGLPRAAVGPEFPAILARSEHRNPPTVAPAEPVELVDQQRKVQSMSDRIAAHHRDAEPGAVAERGRSARVDEVGLAGVQHERGQRIVRGFVDQRDDGRQQSRAGFGLVGQYQGKSDEHGGDHTDARAGARSRQRWPPPTRWQPSRRAGR